MLSKPGLIIWSSAIVSVALAVSALANFRAQTSEAGRGQAIGILLICALIAGVSIWRLVRLYRTASAVADLSQVSIGVPIRPSRGRALAVALLMLAVGAVPLALMTSLSPVNYWGAWLLVVAGAGMLAAVVAGVLPIGHIEFRSDSLVLALRGLTLVLPWERITAVEGGEFGGNPALFLEFDDPAAIAVPAAKQRAFLRQVALNQDLTGADYYLITTGYRIGLPTLVAAVEHYRSERARVPV